MNRRSFLTRLGVAAVGAAALAVDPERLLWVPGAKTIIDFGATKQVLPATDAEVIQSATQKLLARSEGAAEHRAFLRHRDQIERENHWKGRDVRLDIAVGGGMTSFHYSDDKLVSLHTEEELKLLDKPLWPGDARRSS